MGEPEGGGESGEMRSAESEGEEDAAFEVGEAHFEPSKVVKLPKAGALLALEDEAVQAEEGAVERSDGLGQGFAGGFAGESLFEDGDEFFEFPAAYVFEVDGGEDFDEFVEGEKAPDDREVVAEDDSDEGFFEGDVIVPGEGLLSGEGDEVRVTGEVAGFLDEAELFAERVFSAADGFSEAVCDGAAAEAAADIYAGGGVGEGEGID